MALYSDLPVYKSTYDLSIFRFTKDFGKEYKYTVGESLKKETIEQMENFHKDRVGESVLFRGSGERTLFSVWDSKYPKEDVDEAIQQLKPTLLTDEEISQEMLSNIVLNKSDRVIK